jgi:uracil-DNA glycosylase family 4
MPVSGAGRLKILIVGEAPGREEDSQGKAFVGKSGQLLKDVFRKNGVDLYKDCWITNSLICRPPHNRDPTPQELEYCKPNLVNTLRELKPEMIMPLGRFGIKQVMSLAWKGDPGEGYKWLGWQIPHQKWNAWICPTYHPAFILRKIEDGELEKNYWEYHLENALALKGKRPWKSVPNYLDQVEIIKDDKRAAKIINLWNKAGCVVAFDYETNMIKPDSRQAAIISCSVCFNGHETIAFPWYGRVQKAMTELLTNREVGKIASNLKFEDRWTRAILGIEVKNWLWDTMIAAHVVDNREDITGLKFQSFVTLGVESYDEHIKRFLQAKKGRKVNQILEEIDMDQLLTYNGLDSLLEYLVAKKQTQYLKHPTGDLL